VTVRLGDADGALTAPPVTLDFAYANDAANEAQVRDRQIHRRVARLYMARAMVDGLEANRAGDYAGARRILGGCRDSIRSQAGDDEELLALVAELDGKLESYGRAMDPLARKRTHYGYTTGMKGLSEADLARASQPAAGGVTVMVSHPALFSPVTRGLRALVPPAPDLFGDVAARLLAPSLPSLDLLSGQEERALVEETSRRNEGARIRFLFTPRRLEDNWFSHWHAGAGVAVVSMADWDGGFEVPPEAFVAFQLVQHGLRLLAAPGFDPRALLHDETRGCFFDLCQTREDIEIKLQTGHLCPDCYHGLIRGQVPLDRVQSLLEVIRTLASLRS
jgi:hypothetical protein